MSPINMQYSSVKSPTIRVFVKVDTCIPSASTVRSIGAARICRRFFPTASWKLMTSSFVLANGLRLTNGGV